MKIIDYIDVKLPIGGPPIKSWKSFDIEDNGNIFTVDIPDHPEIIKQFRYLSDNTLLRYLKSPYPVTVSNADLVDRLNQVDQFLKFNGYQFTAQAIREKLKEDDLLEYYVEDHLSFNTPFLKIPVLDQTVIWTFKDSKAATLFKLGFCNGD